MSNRMKFYNLLFAVIFAASMFSSPARTMAYSRPRTVRDIPLPSLLASASSALRDFTPNMPPPHMFSYTYLINTPCGPAVIDNASYCSRNHTIYYDYNLINRVYRDVGDFAAVSIIAHEWGHALQAYSQVAKGPYFNIQLELQADSFAGEFAGYANCMGYLDERDLDEAAKGLFESGDPKGMPWFNIYAHGSPLNRVRAFLDGYDGFQCYCDCPYS